MTIPVPTNYIEIEKTNGDTIRDLIMTQDLYLQLQNKKTGNILEPLHVNEKAKLSNHSLLGDYIEKNKKPHTLLRRLKRKENSVGGKRHTRKARKQRRLTRKFRA